MQQAACLPHSFVYKLKPATGCCQGDEQAVGVGWCWEGKGTVLPSVGRQDEQGGSESPVADPPPLASILLGNN